MKPNERKFEMKSNLAIIEDAAKFQTKSVSQKPSVQTVAEGVKLPALKNSNPIFDRPFGKEGHTLGEALEHQASVYKSLVKQRKNQLEKLKEIGLVLIELRSISGASDKNYGILVSKTPLSIMSRQDRFDAMWLAENWTNVQSYMKEMDISSGSAAYLRQKIKGTKPAAESKTQGSDEPSAVESKTDAKPSAGVQSSDKKEPTSTEPSAPATVEASSQKTETPTEVSVDSEDDFALSMAQIAEQSGLDLKKVINALLKLA
jgi:hypothetical protein